MVESSRQMARPRPVPPNWRVTDPSAWENFPNRRGRCSGSMPGPVSRTTIQKPATSRATSTDTWPWLVNFSALDNRFISIWRTRPGSPRQIPSADGSTRQVS